MAKIKVVFEYHTGLLRKTFRNVRLVGSWDQNGRPGPKMRVVPMEPLDSADGCPAYRAEVLFDSSQVGRSFDWSVLLDVPGRPNMRGVMTEDGSFEESAQKCSFDLKPEGSVESYWLTHCRRLGANKYFSPERDRPGLQFSVWAPNAQKVETVIASEKAGGYIWDDGRGVEKTFAMNRDEDGIWHTDPGEADLAEFDQWVGRHYMFRVTRDDGSVAYRSDIFSRAQSGSGGKNPQEDKDWDGTPEDLEATKSCSVVVDPELITAPQAGHYADVSGEEIQNLGRAETESPPASVTRDRADKEVACLEEDDFWAHEFNPVRPIPSRVEEMVIYEMHVGGLGFHRQGPGTLEDAIDMLDYLTDLGINAIELLPMNVFDGEAGWGYGTSHYYAIKYDEGGHDQFKHFVRACHRRGIAVIMDVVYNHYTPDSERAEWMYDSTAHDRNLYYFYKGLEADYPENFPEGGYCDNLSTGYLPNMAEEMVRKMLIGSAVTMAMEFHVDGFRMDLTQALHSFNVLHLDGSPVPEANESGIRFMREWARTLRLFKPFVVLLAEDHSGWEALAKAQPIGGVGFDATWWSEWYHQLIGDATSDTSKARLIHTAGLGGDDPLNMEVFGQVIMGTPRHVIYHESHDEAGNSQNSARTMEVAVGGMLFDNTRYWAEARCRVAAGLTILAAGTPMFFMGEEVCAANPYRYNDFVDFKEDYAAMRQGAGARMFRYYQDLIRLRIFSPALRSLGIELVFTHNEDRILAFRRWSGVEEYLVVASLNNKAFEEGYPLAHETLAGKSWREILNSDDDVYGGSEVLNPEVLVGGEGFRPRLPACGITVFARM